MLKARYLRFSELYTILPMYTLWELYKRTDEKSLRSSESIPNLSAFQQSPAEVKHRTLLITVITNCIFKFGCMLEANNSLGELSACLCVGVFKQIPSSEFKI